jgi:hypothetical protein
VLCHAVQALGLDEGHAVCQALQDVKLAVNTGSYGPLESASGAVAVCVLADWFETFTEVSVNLRSFVVALCHVGFHGCYGMALT